MTSDWINFEYQALIQENVAFTGGFRSGIRTLCAGFFAKELLVSEIHLLSTNETVNEDILVNRVLGALRVRVKLDPSALGSILDVLNTTTGMTYLATRLQERLEALRKEHARQVEHKARQTEELVMLKRPTDLQPALFRDTGAAYNTEPVHKHISSPAQSYFQKAASSVGSEIRSIPAGSPYESLSQQASSITYMEPVTRSRTGRVSQTQLEPGVDKVQTRTLLMMQSPQTSHHRHHGVAVETRVGSVSIDIEGEAHHNNGAAQLKSDGQERRETGQERHRGESGRQERQENGQERHGRESGGQERQENGQERHEGQSDEQLCSPHAAIPRGGDDDDNQTGSPLNQRGEHQSVPETHTYTEQNGNSMFLVATIPPLHVRTFSTGESTETFATAPNSPEPTSPNSPSSMNSLGSTNSLRSCGECLNLRRQISQLKSQLDNLRLSRDLKLQMNAIQIEELTQEIHEQEQARYETKLVHQRHREQQEIIRKLQNRIEQMSLESQQTCGGTGGSDDGERRERAARRICEVSRELEREKEGKEQERIEKERERQEKERERWEKERERDMKERETREKRCVMEENSHLREENCQLAARNKELEEELRRLYGELKRANSLQCDEQGYNMKGGVASQQGGVASYQGGMASHQGGVASQQGVSQQYGHASSHV